MNRLKDQTFYLCGAIDRCPNLGIEWRKRFQERLVRDYGANVYNPMQKPIAGPNPEDPVEREKRRQLKLAGKYDEFSEEMAKVVHLDYRQVDKSDALIIHIDTDIHMCGSYHETDWARLARKPVIIWCKQGKIGVPDWMFGIFKHKWFFSTEKEVFQYLDHIDKDPYIEDGKRWLFFER